MEFVQGDLLEAEAEALVNAVNTVGTMGKGIARAFKTAFPDNYRAYARACRAGEVEVGRVFAFERRGAGPRWIVNFPTKQHWRNASRIEWIDDGLRDLRAFIEARTVRSIAVPALGCGLGGLDWSVVRPRIEAALGDLDGTRVLVYEPLGIPQPT